MKFIPAMANGLGVTLFLSLVPLIIGIIPGILLYFCKNSKIKTLYFISTAYIELFNGVPLLVQLFFFYYVLPTVIPFFVFNQMTTAIIVLALNAAADIGYNAKLISESRNAEVYHYNDIKIFILSVVKEFGRLIKYTSLLSLIALVDLFRTANAIMRENNDILPIFTAIIIYLVLSIIIKIIYKALQKSFEMSREVTL